MLETATYPLFLILLASIAIAIGIYTNAEVYDTLQANLGNSSANVVIWLIFAAIICFSVIGFIYAWKEYRQRCPPQDACGPRQCPQPKKPPTCTPLAQTIAYIAAITTAGFLFLFLLLLPLAQNANYSLCFMMLVFAMVIGVITVVALAVATFTSNCKTICGPLPWMGMGFVQMLLAVMGVLLLIYPMVVFARLHRQAPLP